MADTSDYLKNRNTLFSRVTGGRVLQVMTLKKLFELMRSQFPGAAVGVTDGHYCISLNVSWWYAPLFWMRRRKVEPIVFEWLKQMDPDTKSIRIRRVIKDLAREQAVLS